ncbi:DM13 domain-containing protein [Cognatishimia sp. F0-27]|uniref:DM13 domain-containing protein n=1 Tax=Cognatishimia sp. F0-27 TaxID=2816855 RepID=UPI001D0CD450|nr:DM13 domain-containing protein [Cognatishimia sp. F0-27]MCC1491819.1 DM13 domain-containing protein [Cognatishimia sp. F0-27]
MRKLILALVTHGAALAVGFGLGVYFLPILTAPASPDAAMLESRAQNASFTAALTRDLRGSDFLHWGEGTISITDGQIVHMGALAPGPDYKLYLVDSFVEHEDEFLPIKDRAQLIGDVDSFGGFLLDIPEGVDVTRYTTAVIWCEAFSEFITAGQYRQ